MRLGIIGAGHVGGTLGRLFESQGHDVRFGVRDPDKEAAGGLPRNRSGPIAGCRRLRRRHHPRDSVERSEGCSALPPALSPERR